jgi:hypothetical protein
VIQATSSRRSSIPTSPKRARFALTR